ncbi:hypothetical protein [Cyanobium sp. Morenito 9A2]|uniref:hypothetical protein n=1 Tax=Cyanobium sp. Morenito 9A2 TaxID=2823718 RepID=UPI0020CED01E|nr:hypothetical protein [Cyanobium sp. Morenito 9A2]MCP9848628.1 hypothetical protein [Cyanobium sp. Morenito 9A2]
MNPTLSERLRRRKRQRRGRFGVESPYRVPGDLPTALAAMRGQPADLPPSWAPLARGAVEVEERRGEDGVGPSGPESEGLEGRASAPGTGSVEVALSLPGGQGVAAVPALVLEASAKRQTILALVVWMLVVVVDGALALQELVSPLLDRWDRRVEAPGRRTRRRVLPGGAVGPVPCELLH